MKKVKRFLALGLAVAAMAMSMAACGDAGEAGGTEGQQETGQQPEGAQEDAGQEQGEAENTPKTEGAYKIGYNYFGSGSYALLCLADNSQLVIDAFGNEGMAMDDEFNVEKIVQDVENMIASGCDGLIIWLPAEQMYPTIAKICADAKVPFVLNDKIPTDPDIIAELKANEYCAGAIAPDNEVYGEMLAQYALDQGWKKCIISAPAAGDPSDTPRIEAFRSVFEGAGGTVYDELHADTADAALPQIENALTANSDIDFVYGSGSDYGIAASQALQNMNVDAKVLTSGLDSKALDLLAAGDIELVNGDYWVCGTFAAVILQNYLDGTPLKDAEGNVVWIDDVQPFEVPAAEYDLYRQCFLDNKYFTAEELVQMSGKTNPDFNYDAFVELVHSYSLDERLTAHGYK